MANKKKNSGGKRKSGGAASISAKEKKTLITIVAVIVAIVIIAAVIVYFFFPDLFNKAKDAYLSYVETLYNDSADDDPDGTAAVVSVPVDAGDKEQIAGDNSAFSIHFLELGNKYAGDCTLIKCGNTEVLIDAGSRKNSAAAIKQYVDQYCTDNTLEYVIATHAHQDHIAGFVGTGSGDNKDGILYKYNVGTVIQFAGHNSNSGIYTSYVSAVSYAKNKGAVAYTAAQCWNETDGAKKQYDLSVAQDKSLTLNILYNYYYEHETKDENDYSVCVLLTYTAENGTKSNYLFTGDLEGEGESKMVDYYASSATESLPEVELFKGAHHGSKTSSTDKLLSVIKPKNVAVCCCAGATEYTTNNDNTFPTQDFSNRISKYTENVYCTSICEDYKNSKFGSMNGNIVFYYDLAEADAAKRLKLWCSNNMTKLKDTQWFKDHRKYETTQWQAA